MAASYYAALTKPVVYGAMAAKKQAPSGDPPPGGRQFCYSSNSYPVSCAGVEYVAVHLPEPSATGQLSHQLTCTTLIGWGTSEIVPARHR